MFCSKNSIRNLFLFFVTFIIGNNAFGGGQLIGSSGVTQMEGSAGGGMVPWATITGYGTRDEQSTTAFLSLVNVDDFHMRAFGVAHGFNNRTEISFSQLGSKERESNDEVRQNIVGVKVRLTGDLMFTPWPQIAAGVQYKNSLNSKDLNSASDSSGYDFYVAATKVWIDGPFHRSMVVNTTLRYSNANQLGLLGFGGDKQDNKDLLLEVSAGVFLNRNWIVGGEYRQKPDNFKHIKEDDWKNIFVGFIPNKQIAITAAVVDLGNIGTKSDQKGGYLSFQFAF